MIIAANTLKIYFCPSFYINVPIPSRNKNVVSYTKGATMAAKLGAAMYLECSALNKGEGLKELFDAAVKVANDAIQAKRKKNKDYTSGSAGMCCTII